MWESPESPPDLLRQTLRMMFDGVEIHVSYRDLTVCVHDTVISSSVTSCACAEPRLALMIAGNKMEWRISYEPVPPPHG